MAMAMEQQARRRQDRRQRGRRPNTRIRVHERSSSLLVVLTTLVLVGMISSTPSSMLSSSIIMMMRSGTIRSTSTSSRQISSVGILPFGTSSTAAAAATMFVEAFNVLDTNRKHSYQYRYANSCIVYERIRCPRSSPRNNPCRGKRSFWLMSTSSSSSPSSTSASASSENLSYQSLQQAEDQDGDDDDDDDEILEICDEEENISPTDPAVTASTSATTALSTNGLIAGSNDGFYVVKVYETDPSKEFDLQQIEEMLVDSAGPATTTHEERPNSTTATNTTTTSSGGRQQKNNNNNNNNDLQRLGLTPTNISVPIALMLLDPDEYPSRSKARKACRKANIMIHRGPLLDKEPVVNGQQQDDGDGDDHMPSLSLSSAAEEEEEEEEASRREDDIISSSSSVLPPNKSFNIENCFRAKVGDRIYPGDVVAKQIRVGEGSFPMMNHQRPPFDLPVVYEDDYFAIVNKPAGVVVYAQRKGGHGIMTVRAALPFAVQPPTPGTLWTLRRPQPVHRLDKPTSGLLIVAKTKPSMVHLSHQFRDRKVKKTYTAIVNGIPQEPVETSITAKDAVQLGVDVGVGVGTDRNASESSDLSKKMKSGSAPEANDATDRNDDDGKWQIIDHPLDEKSAVTVWRALRYSRSLKAHDDYLTVVELKPKTGRYHQLRRHLAWVCERHIVGDKEYDAGDESAMSFRNRGLFLCSNRVMLEHPHYNDAITDRNERYRFFQKYLKNDKETTPRSPMYDVWWSDHDGKIMVTASIPLPEKFLSFLEHEEERYVRFGIGETKQ